VRRQKDFERPLDFRGKTKHPLKAGESINFLNLDLNLDLFHRDREKVGAKLSILKLGGLIRNQNLKAFHFRAR
jgi:hypothetical protein